MYSTPESMLAKQDKNSIIRKLSANILWETRVAGLFILIYIQKYTARLSVIQATKRPL